MTRRIKGQTTAWITGTSAWDIERLHSTENVGDFWYGDNDMTDMGWIKVGTASFDVLLTTDKSAIVTAQVNVLKQQAQKIRADAEVKANEIENEIKNLLALTYDPATQEAA